MYSPQKNSHSDQDSRLSSRLFNSTGPGKLHSKSIDSPYLQEDMIQVAQLLVSKKYYNVIHAITYTRDTIDMEPQIFIHAQQQAAQGVTSFAGLDAGEPFKPDFQLPTANNLGKAEFAAIFKMKTVEIEFMKNNSIDNWKAEHILTARRLVSALCLIKYNYAIISASQEEIVNRFIKLLIERFNKNFQELATEARKIKLSEGELMGYRSSFPSKKVKNQVKDQTEAVMSYVPDRRKSTNTVRKTQKNTQLGVLRILWNKWNNLFAS